ncbi:ABC transporter permease [Planosporangium sp. 12N6]|uniref:ABC transporter permease n=1 Tax=Planosporangium spinosum TaxID=3402278 RepID=UPI003CF44B84
MAYDDRRYRGDPDRGADPDSDLFGGSYTYPPAGLGERTKVAPQPGYPQQATLDDLFEDPTHGEPGRDRVGVHLVWELLLLLVLAGFGYLLYRDGRSAVTGDGLRGLMISGTVLGLLVLGTGLSLRAASPNLAVGPVALASAMYLAEHSGRGMWIAAGQSVVLALGVGAAVALVTVGLHVPAWAASFGAGLGVIVWIQQHHRVLELPRGMYQPVPHAFYWFGGFAALAVLGGVLGAVRPLRRAVGRFRPVADPADRRGGAAAAVSVTALIGSSALAALAGVLMALRAGRVAPVDTSLALESLALGGALLAGTSVFGRRGGVLGTVLATTLLIVVIRYLEVTERHVAQLAIGAVAIGVGLVGSRAVEAFGRPYPVFEPDSGQWRTITPATDTARLPLGEQERGGAGSRTGGWTSPLPASSADDHWGDDDWRGR